MSFQVLIIDDAPDFKKLLEMRIKAILEDANFNWCQSLSDAREFLKSRSHLALDLVILDEHLPDGRGADLLGEGWFADLAVLSMSSDDAPEIAGNVISKGATFFLSKRCISEPLFEPLVLGVIDRNKLQRQLIAARIEAATVDTIKTLIGTLKHEINNPLGAVLGAAYLFKSSPSSTPQQRDAATLIEDSGKRIKYVMDQLSSALALETVSKGDVPVFHVPGDVKWEDKH